MRELVTLGPWLRRFLTEHIVTERNFKGEILWEHKSQGPIACQRLRSSPTVRLASSR